MVTAQGPQKRGGGTPQKRGEKMKKREKGLNTLVVGGSTRFSKTQKKGNGGKVGKKYSNLLEEQKRKNKRKKGGGNRVKGSPPPHSKSGGGPKVWFDGAI